MTKLVQVVPRLTFTTRFTFRLVHISPTFKQQHNEQALMKQIISAPLQHFRLVEVGKSPTLRPVNAK